MKMRDTLLMGSLLISNELYGPFSSKLKGGITAELSLQILQDRACMAAL
jgi:hypothetical protein